MKHVRSGVMSAAVVAALVLGGCSSDPDVPREPIAGGTQTPTTPPTSSATPTPSGNPIPEMPEAGRVIRGLNPATTEDERAVAEVWFSYREELNRMYREVSVDQERLSELAFGAGFDSPVAYVDRMKRANTHNEGGNISSITSVTVTGDSAVVLGCLRSTMVEVDANGRPVELPEVFVVFRDTLTREGPDWRLSKHRTVSTGTACTYR